MNKVFIMIILLCSLAGCTTTRQTEQEQKEPLKSEIVQDLVTDKQVELHKVDWSKYSEYTLFSFYLILLFAACVYFKKTGKRLPEIEAPLTSMAPKLSTRAKILSLLAKVLGLIYCKKK